MDCRGVVKECSQSTLKGVLYHRTFGGPSIGPRISTWLRGVCRSRLIVDKWLGWKLIVVRSYPIWLVGDWSWDRWNDRHLVLHSVDLVGLDVAGMPSEE